MPLRRRRRKLKENYNNICKRWRGPASAKKKAEKKEEEGDLCPANVLLRLSRHQAVCVRYEN
jgi:hypothetical protein